MLHLCSSLPFLLRLCSASRRLLGPAHLSGPLNGGRKVRVCHKVCARGDPTLPHVLHRTNAAGDAADQRAARSAAQSALGGLAQQFAAQQPRRLPAQQGVHSSICIGLHEFFCSFFPGAGKCARQPRRFLFKLCNTRKRRNAVNDTVCHAVQPAGAPHVPHHLRDAQSLNVIADRAVCKTGQGRRFRAAAFVRHIRNAAAQSTQGLFDQQSLRPKYRRHPYIFSGHLAQAVSCILHVAQAKARFAQAFISLVVDLPAQPVHTASQPVDVLRPRVVIVEQKIFQSLRHHGKTHQRRAYGLASDACRTAGNAVPYIVPKRHALLVLLPPGAYLLDFGVGIPQLVHPLVNVGFLPGRLLRLHQVVQPLAVVPFFQPLVILVVQRLRRPALCRVDLLIGVPVLPQALPHDLLPPLCGHRAQAGAALRPPQRLHRVVRRDGVRHSLPKLPVRLLPDFLIPVRRLVLQLSAALHHAHQAVQQPAGFLVLFLPPCLPSAYGARAACARLFFLFLSPCFGVSLYQVVDLFSCGHSSFTPTGIAVYTLHLRFPNRCTPYRIGKNTHPGP